MKNVNPTSLVGIALRSYSLLQIPECAQYKITAMLSCIEITS
jgi:hypothetical protein